MSIKINGVEIGISGPAGKSAYQAAKDAGFTGSEAEFNQSIASVKDKQNKLSGTKGQIIGFDDNGDAVAQSKPTYTASEVGALPSSTSIPSKTSQLTNDSGFITGYTETDPTVPSWAKASSKPTYTASEVGATPASHVSDATIHITDNERTVWNAKQDTIIGTQGQIVGFDDSGNAVAQDRESDVFWATYDTTTYAEVVAAHQAGKLVQVIRGGRIYRLYGVNEKKAEFQAYAGLFMRYNACCYADNTWEREYPGYIAGKSVSITLSASAWNSESMTQTVPVSGVSSNEGDQLITPTPALASQTAYYEAGILCTGQAADSLTFTCTTVPTEDLTVYVVIQGVTQG